MRRPWYVAVKAGIAPGSSVIGLPVFLAGTDFPDHLFLRSRFEAKRLGFAPTKRQPAADGGHGYPQLLRPSGHGLRDRTIRRVGGQGALDTRWPGFEAKRLPYRPSQRLDPLADRLVIDAGD